MKSPSLATLLGAFLLFSPALLCAPLSVGITPLKSASRLAEDWQPLIAEVGKRAGIELVFRTATDVPAFGERLAQGKYDIAYMNPYHYALHSARPGYRAFVRERGRPLAGIIIVRKDSPYRKLADLAGRTVIFPTPLAFAASLLTQAELQHQGIAIDARYVQSHDSVLHGVKLRAAFLSLNRDAEGRRLLDRVAFKGMEAAADKDYNDIRRLDMSRLIDNVN
jgi:phosphonate transport system substrate-binding protein